MANINYGPAISRSNTGTMNGNNHTTYDGTDESQPLLPKAGKKPLGRRFRNYMREDISTTHGDLVLLFCYIITGLLDSSAVFIWGAFVSMQTGNTVYLGLGIVDPKSGTRWIKSAISIGFFSLGSFFFARFHRLWKSPRQRWVMVSSFGIQMLLIAGSAVMITLDAEKEEGLHWHVILPLALVAFQASGQAVASRVLGFNQLNSVVLTSVYCDLFADEELFAGPTQSIGRNRRLAAPICLAIGAVTGGFWTKTSLGLAGPLWTAVCFKLFIVVGWMFWRRDEPEDEESEDS